jgi:hypothetical protein
MVKCEVAKRTLKLYSWVPSLLQICSSLSLTAESELKAVKVLRALALGGEQSR